MADDWNEDFLKADRLNTWGLGLIAGALLLGAAAALVLRATGVAHTIAYTVFIGAALIAVAGFLLWLVGEIRSRRVMRRMPMRDVTELIEKKRWPEAIARLEPQLSSTDPDQVATASNLLADAYAATGRNAEAEALLRRSIELTGLPNDTLGEQLISLGAVVRRQDRIEEAEEIYARALDVLRKTEDTEATVFALRNVAYLYWSIGQDERAREIYAEMPEYDPDRLEFLSDILKPFEEPPLPAPTYGR